MNTAELRELVQAGEGGLLAVERLPVRGSREDELDQRRVEEYFRRVFGEEEIDDWTQTLLHRELLVETDVDAALCCSYAGYALFALEPRRRLPQAGMRLLVFPGTDMDYDANLDEVLDLPFVGLGKQQPGRFIEQTSSRRCRIGR